MAKNLLTCLLLGSALMLASSTFCGGVEENSLPELDGEKPAAGLEMSYSLRNSTFEVGGGFSICCTITNITKRTKPLMWRSRGALNFLLSPDKTFPPTGGTGLHAYPQISQPLVIKSLGMDSYILFFPLGKSLTFLLRIDKLDKHEWFIDKDGKFTGRVIYKPLGMRSTIKAVPDGSTWKDEHLCSDVFTCEVIEHSNQK